MTLTLTLPHEIEALLRQRAERTSQDVSSIAVALLAFGLSFDEQDFFEALEGIQAGLNDFEQGLFCSFEEFISDQNQKQVGWAVPTPFLRCKRDGGWKYEERSFTLR